MAKTLKLSWAEFENHKNDKNSIYIAMNDKIYDVARWLNKHPGGDHVLTSMGGKDATDVITNFHPPYVLKLLNQYYVGDLVYTEEEMKIRNKSHKPGFVQDMRDLNLFFEGNKWYIPSVTYFVLKTLTVFAIAAFGIFCTIYGDTIKNVYLQLLGGLTIGFFWQQANFLGHDAGHNSVVLANHKTFAMVYGTIIGPLSSGISLQWWKHSHFTHHVMTNICTHDPDIQVSN